VTATGSWSIYRWGWQFFSSEGLDEAYVPFFGAFGAAWDDATLRVERQFARDARVGHGLPHS
jgi:hypothetical protein